MSDKKKSKYTDEHHHQSVYRREFGDQGWITSPDHKPRSKRKHEHRREHFQDVQYDEKHYQKLRRDDSAHRYKTEEHRSQGGYEKRPSGKIEHKRGREFEHYRDSSISSHRSKSSKYVQEQNVSLSYSPLTSLRVRSPSFSSNESANQKNKSKKRHPHQMIEQKQQHVDAIPYQQEPEFPDKKTKKERGRSKERRKKKLENRASWQSPNTSEERSSVSSKARSSSHHEKVVVEQGNYRYEREYVDSSPSKKKSKLSITDSLNSSVESLQYSKPKKMHKKEKDVSEKESKEKPSKEKKHKKKHKNSSNEQQPQSTYKLQEPSEYQQEDHGSRSKHIKKKGKDKTKPEVVQENYGRNKSSDYEPDNPPPQFDEDFPHKTKKRKKQTHDEEGVGDRKISANRQYHSGTEQLKRSHDPRKPQNSEQEYASRSSSKTYQPDRKRKHSEIDNYAVKEQHLQYLEQNQSHKLYKEQQYIPADAKVKNIPKNKDHYPRGYNHAHDYNRQRHPKHNKRDSALPLKSEVRYSENSEPRHTQAENRSDRGGYPGHTTYSERPMMKKPSKHHYEEIRIGKYKEDSFKQQSTRYAHNKIHYDQQYERRDVYPPEEIRHDHMELRQRLDKRHHVDYSSRVEDITQHRDPSHFHRDRVQYKSRPREVFIDHNKSHNFERKPGEQRYSDLMQSKRHFDGSDKTRSQDTFYRKSVHVDNRGSYGVKSQYSSSKDSSYNRRLIEPNVNYREKGPGERDQSRRDYNVNFDNSPRNYTNKNYQGISTRKYQIQSPMRYVNRGQPDIKRPFQNDNSRKLYQYDLNRKPEMTRHREGSFQSTQPSYNNAKPYFIKYDRSHELRSHVSSSRNNYERSRSKSRSKNSNAKSQDYNRANKHEPVERRHRSRSKNDSHRQSLTHQDKPDRRPSRYRSYDKHARPNDDTKVYDIKDNNDNVADPLEVDWVSSSETKNEKDETLPLSAPTSSIMKQFTPANLLRECGVIEDLLPDYLLEKVSDILQNSQAEQTDPELTEHLDSMSKQITCDSDSKFRQYLNGKSKTYPQKVVPPLIINARTYDMSMKHYALCMESPREV